jgi:microcystin degradation protein MlrC
MSINRPRIALGGILHETHSFMVQPTTLADFAAQTLHYDGEVLTRMAGTRAGIAGMIAACGAYHLIPTIYAAAMPSGVVTAHAYQTLLEALLMRLRDALPLDGVLLALHGAMVTETTLDAESDILEQVRAVIGPAVPLVVELDMHGNLSPRMLQLADVLVAYDTNPHLDVYERGFEAGVILNRLMNREIRPTAAYATPGVLLAAQYTGTRDLPLAAVHARTAEMERDPTVICICVMSGFAYADTPYTGASVVVTTDNRPDLARQSADELAALMVRHRDSAAPRLLSPAEAVRQAQTITGGPVILVDSADNIGGGTPGDGTNALVALLEQNVLDGTIVLADSEAVARCWEAGVGAQVSLSVGGKTDQWHGQPVAVTGVVRTLSDGVFACELPDNPFASFYGATIQMGRTAWLRVGGVNILLTERKTPPFDLAQLRGVGIIPETQKMIVVKSAVAYRAAYLPIAAGVIELDTAGLCSANLIRFPYQQVPRPIFPLDNV